MDQETHKDDNSDKEEQQVDESKNTQTQQTENKNEEKELEPEQIQNQNQCSQNSPVMLYDCNQSTRNTNDTTPLNQSTSSSAYEPVSQTQNFQDSIQTLAQIINNIDNQVLLQKAPLESLCNLLQIAQPSEFDDLSDPTSMKELIEQQYQRKRSDLEMLIYHVMKGYDELNQKVNLNQLEKIMRILKSKNKSIYITKDGIGEQALQCVCHHHQIHQQEQEEDNIEQNIQQQEQKEEQEQLEQQQQQEQQEQQEQQQQQQLEQQSQLEQEQQSQLEQQQQLEQVRQQKNILEQNEQINTQNNKNEVEIQTDQVEQNDQQVDQDEQLLGDLIQKQKEQFEEFQQQIEQNKTALQSQEEEIDQQIQQVEKQDEQQQLTQEQLEQNVEQLKHSIQRSREQIEKLTEQRDILLEKSRELAQKQQELKIQQQQILRQLKQNEEEEEENKPISCQDIFGIMTLNTLNLNQLQNYNDQTNSLVFKLSKSYTVEIKSDDSDYMRYLNDTSNLKMIPSIILTRHIFPFLSALELFKIREVCGWFKDQVKKAWPIVFKREMFEQLLARDLAKNIYTVLSLQTLKGTLYFKVQNLIEAIIHAIQWEKVEDALQQEQMDINIYRPLIALLALFNKQQEIEYPHQIDGTFDIKELAKDMKNQVIQYIQANFLPLSFNQMRKINENLLSAPEFSVEFLASKEDKLPLYLTILLQQLYYHGLIHQTFIIDSFQLDKWKIEQELLGKRQSYNQNFLEGAYKKLLLRTYQDDGEDDQSLENLNSDINEAQQFLRALTNLTPTENPEPDIVIRRNKTVTKIFIDIHTKMDILVQTIEQYRNQSLQQEANIQKEQQDQSVQIQTDSLQQQGETEKEVQTENQEEINEKNNNQQEGFEIQQVQQSEEDQQKKLIEEENLNQPKE